jgi:type I restriction enzyme S subunit
MIAGLKPYPAMKGSGVPWPTDIPAAWEVRRNGQLFSQRNQTGFPDLPILEVSLKTGVRVRDFDSSARKQVMSDREKYKLVRQGDITYNMMRMWQGAVGVAPVDGLVSPAYVVARPHTDVVARYYDFLFRTDSYKSEVNKFSRGIVSDRNRLYWEDFKQIPSPCPPSAEQAAIVRFLDHADRRIWRYIRAKQKLIKLLEEQKQAIIHRAITRGLDPNVRLKPSGVDWLRDVPEHWERRTLGQIATSFRTGPFGSILHQSDYVEGGTPLVNPTHMNRGAIVEDMRCSVPPAVVARLSNYLLATHDLVFSRRGELGRCALVRDREAGWICGTGSIRVRVAYAGIEPEYLIEALQVRWVGEYLSLFSVGATMESLNTGILKGISVLLPPVSEQRAIIEHIAHETRTLEQAISGSHREIDLFREYRTRLIADVVTGKLDVRAAAAGLPEEVEEADVVDVIEEGETLAPEDDQEPMEVAEGAEG